MSSEPLLYESQEDSLEMTPTKDSDISVAGGYDRRLTLQTNSNSVDDGIESMPAVPSRRQRVSDLFTILCAGCALISDGYANSLMTLINVVLGAQYPKQYVSAVSTRVSNALLVGEICGQITIGFVFQLSFMSYFL